MKTFLRAAAFAALTSFFAFGPAASESCDGEPQVLPMSPLSIETTDGDVHSFTVGVADDSRERSYGLMFKKHLPDDEGMLFVFAEPVPVSFWMRNTCIPLDMIFVDGQGRVAEIVANTTPFSLQSIRPEGPMKAVLEVRGGLAAALGIEPGDTLIHPLSSD